KYVRLHVGAEAHLLREGLNQVEAKLDPARFVRIHRSTLVNVRCIKALEPGFHGDSVVHLRDGTELPLSRSHRARLYALFGKSGSFPETDGPCRPRDGSRPHSRRAGPATLSSRVRNAGSPTAPTARRGVAWSLEAHRMPHVFVSLVFVTSLLATAVGLEPTADGDFTDSKKQFDYDARAPLAIQTRLLY